MILQIILYSEVLTLREKCPNTELLLVRIFARSDRTNAGKYGPEKTPYLDTFHTVSPRTILKMFSKL